MYSLDGSFDHSDRLSQIDLQLGSVTRGESLTDSEAEQINKLMFSQLNPRTFAELISFCAITVVFFSMHLLFLSRDFTAEQAGEKGFLIKHLAGIAGSFGAVIGMTNGLKGFWALQDTQEFTKNNRT